VRRSRPSLINLKRARICLRESIETEVNLPVVPFDRMNIECCKGASDQLWDLGEHVAPIPRYTSRMSSSCDCSRHPRLVSICIPVRGARSEERVVRNEECEVRVTLTLTLTPCVCVSVSARVYVCVELGEQRLPHSNIERPQCCHAAAPTLQGCHFSPTSKLSVKSHPQLWTSIQDSYSLLIINLESLAAFNRS